MRRDCSLAILAICTAISGCIVPDLTNKSATGQDPNLNISSDVYNAAGDPNAPCTPGTFVGNVLFNGDDQPTTYDGSCDLTGDITVTAHASATQMTQLGKIQAITGNLTFAAGANSPQLSLGALTRVSGIATFQGVAATVISLAALSNAGGIAIDSCNQLQSVEIGNGASAQMGYVRISNCSQFHNFELNLKQIVQDFALQNDPKLTTAAVGLEWQAVGSLIVEGTAFTSLVWASDATLTIGTWKVCNNVAMPDSAVSYFATLHPTGQLACP